VNIPAGPLNGIRVIDVTQVMAGAYCSMLLADMGADVVKIERPVTGDDTRRMSASLDPEASRAFVAMNRNKRGVALDLKSSEGADVLRKLVMNADVLVENFRPGTMDKLGLGYEQMRELNPSLVYCSITGFGSTGPYRHHGGFDLVAQAMSGLMSVTGTAESEPVKLGAPMCDLNAGLFGAFGVLNAYIHRLSTGEGQFVDTSLLEAGIAATVWETDEWFATGKTPEPTGSAHRLSAPYQALPTADGYIAVGAANQRVWEALCRAIDRTDLLDRTEFASNAARMQHKADLVRELESHLRSARTEDWITRLRKHGVPCGPIYDISQVHSDPHMIERGVTVTTKHPVLGEVRHLTVPVRLSATPPRIRRTAPLLGQHSREVLTECGYSTEQIDQMLANGSVAIPPTCASKEPV